MTRPVVQPTRHPAPGPWARELEVATSQATLSGLFAAPADGGPPRALIVALHGMQLHAGYFDATTSPGLSLLEMASAAGFCVWAPDRPGTRASAGLDDEHRLMRPQADLLLEALDAVAAGHSVGAGVFVVGHSYGAKLAIAMLARAGERSFLGLDINGCGIGLGHGADDTSGRMQSLVIAGDRGPSWGPASLYPKGTISRARLPIDTYRPLPINETLLWPADFAEFAPRLCVPIRVTYGDHERWWPTDEASLVAVRQAFVGSPRVTVHMLQGAGHNLGLGWAAAEHHRAVLEFASECIEAAAPHGPSQSDAAAGDASSV
ncbi:MAG: alpha/beta fold hydrolase [Actinomycetota bacterium]|nr:alpha/beta fold hydrolase [Actinomycetota bacterium]